MSPPAHRFAAAAAAVLAVAEALAQPLDVRDPDSTRDIYLEMEVAPREVYVQEQITCVLRIYRAVEFFDAQIANFEPQGAVVHRLGRDSMYSRAIDGRRYDVIERRFAVFPQASGRLVVPAFRVDARIANADIASAKDGLFDVGRTLRLETEPVEVAVKPHPRTASTPWLPARALTMTEEWPEDPPRIVAGEPVVWTVRLQATGLAVEQLPAVDVSGVEGTRVYPDQPRASNRFDATAVHGERIQPLALVAGAAGELKLPELRVEWWDVEADAPRIASIPARTVNIEPAPTQAQRSATALPGDPAADAASARLWQVVSAALVVVWLVTLGALMHIRRRRGDGSSDSVPSGRTSMDTGVARRRVLDACRRSDPRAARDALLSWAGLLWPESSPRDLIALAPLVGDAPAAEAILALDSALWSSRTIGWDGTNLAARLPRRPRPGPARTRPPPAGGLPSLHPT